MTAEIPRPIKTRNGDDRRATGERRSSSLAMRLRVGLWYQFHRATRVGEFDALPRTAARRGRFAEALLPELLHYEFHDLSSSQQVAPATALAAALDYLWRHPEAGCNGIGEPTAAHTVNELAGYLHRNYAISLLDRRKSDRRRVNGASV